MQGENDFIPAFLVSCVLLLNIRNKEKNDLNPDVPDEIVAFGFHRGALLDARLNSLSVFFHDKRGVVKLIRQTKIGIKSCAVDWIVHQNAAFLFAESFAFLSDTVLCYIIFSINQAFGKVKTIFIIFCKNV